jgi:hypothetical protein
MNFQEYMEKKLKDNLIDPASLGAHVAARSAASRIGMFGGSSTLVNNARETFNDLNKPRPGSSS